MLNNVVIIINNDEINQNQSIKKKYKQYINLARDEQCKDTCTQALKINMS